VTKGLEKDRRTEAGCPQRGEKKEKENLNFLIRIKITTTGE